MSTQTQPNPRHRRSLRIKQGLVVLLTLVIAAVAWDLIRVSTATRSQTNFTATTFQGREWSLETHRGKKPVILNFFGTWCGPCKMELPHLIALKQKYQDRGVELVLITRETPDEVRKSPEFLKMPVTLITNGSHVFDRYRIDGVPHTFMFDRTGKGVFDMEGYTEESLAELEKRLAAQ